jgi:hypothetical protein
MNTERPFSQALWEQTPIAVQDYMRALEARAMALQLTERLRQPADQSRNSAQVNLGLVQSLRGPARAEWNPPAGPSLRTGSGLGARQQPAFG